MSIICLETPEEEAYSFMLHQMIESAIESKDQNEIDEIRSFWDHEEWQDILDKYGTEGSVWYVWWWDGVRAYMLKYNEEEE